MEARDAGEGTGTTLAWIENWKGAPMWNLLADVTPDTLVNVSQLGMAGLMGALWWWSGDTPTSARMN